MANLHIFAKMISAIFLNKTGLIHLNELAPSLKFSYSSKII